MSSTQIHVRNGRMTNTTYAQLDALFTSYKETPQKPIVIYLHGGAIGQKKVEQQIREHLSVSAFKEADCFPIYLLYQSGILEVIVNNVIEAFQAQVGTETLDGSFDALSSLLKQVAQSRKFNRLFKIVAKRVIKKLGADVLQEIQSGSLLSPDGFESTLSATHAKGMFANFAAKIDTLSDLYQIEDDVFSESALFDMAVPYVKDFRSEEIEALKKELAEDEAVKAEAIAGGYDNAEGFESLGAPIHLIWVLVHILIRVIKRFINRTHHGFFETLIEEVLRQFVEGPMQQWWATLKGDMDQLFTIEKEEDREIFAGSALLNLLETHWEGLQEGGERKVFLIGTSAGTTLLSKFLGAAEAQKIHTKVRFHTVFIVPSVTVEEFHQNMTDSRERIQSVRIFGLNDTQERKDQVIKIYRNSILFLISGLLEERVATPLLGLERIYQGQAPFQLHKAENLPIKEVKAYLHAKADFPFVWSEQMGKGPGLNNTGKQHQRIIQDPHLLQSLNEIICGVEPDDLPENGNVVVSTSSSAPAVAAGFESTSQKSWKLSFGKQLPEPGTHPWDSVYAELREKGKQGIMLEADIEGKFLHEYKSKALDSGFESLGSFIPYNEYDPDWPPKTHPKPRIWHLDDDFSQLDSARAHAVEHAGGVVRIAHIDTGYDPDHITFPKDLVRHDLEQSFVPGEEHTGNAHDREKDKKGGIRRQPGHGTGTLSILAGAEVDFPEFNFKGPLGLHRQVEIVPIRISKSVVLLFKQHVLANALRYIISLNDDPNTRIHVVSMSMGGVASRVWAELVNEAYEKGIFIVTAAGNNFAKKPTRTLVYPARFKRVVAACGITHDFTPYKMSLLEKLTEMQGNYGPRKVMDWAMAAFTPNIPWARSGTGQFVSLSGAGTSSATPQIAMAAALYRMKYFKELAQLPGWQQVEVIRHALFSTARKRVPGLDAEDFTLHFGQGILQARKALEIAPDPTGLKETAPDQIVKILSFARMLGGFESTSDSQALYEMLDVELTQLIQQEPTLQELLQDEEVDDFDKLDDEAKREFVAVVTASSLASETLKAFMRRYYSM
ncbi:MAG: S8/S53 family peptidase [Bacteroidota bacterium]